MEMIPILIGPSFTQSRYTSINQIMEILGEYILVETLSESKISINTFQSHEDGYPNSEFC